MAAVDVQARFAWSPWAPVTLVSGKLAFAPVPSGPALYCFRLTRVGGETWIYIGETDELRQRMQHYLHPGPSQRTNQAVNRHLRETLETGGVADRALATKATLWIDGKERPANFASQSQRRLLENAALVAVEASKAFRVMNLEKGRTRLQISSESA